MSPEERRRLVVAIVLLRHQRATCRRDAEASQSEYGKALATGCAIGFSVSARMLARELKWRGK